MDLKEPTHYICNFRANYPEDTNNSQSQLQRADSPSICRVLSVIIGTDANLVCETAYSWSEV